MLQWSHLLASHKSHFQECCTSVLSHALTSAWPHTIEIYIHKHNRRQDYKQATLCWFWCDLAHLGSLPWLDPRHWNNKDEGIEIVDTFKTEMYVLCFEPIVITPKDYQSLSFHSWIFLCTYKELQFWMQLNSSCLVCAMPFSKKGCKMFAYIYEFLLLKMWPMKQIEI